MRPVPGSLNVANGFVYIVIALFPKHAYVEGHGVDPDPIWSCAYELNDSSLEWYNYRSNNGAIVTGSMITWIS